MIQELVQAALAHQRPALARLISLVEDGGEPAQEVMAALYPHTGQAHIIGVTGAPGSGKSTLVTQLALEYRRRNLTVGIIAVDPTSPFSGGALLGDRIRMRNLSGDEGVFIRSMATRGSLGGLAATTGNVAAVLDACGFQRILTETVGAGQTEVDIARTAHTTIVIEVPDAGDEIQSMKAGILEIADLLVVNKADLPSADRVVATLEAMLSLAHAMDWRPPILRSIATTGQGVPEIVDAIEQHVAYLKQSGTNQQRERARVEHELKNILREKLVRRAFAHISRELYEQLVTRIMAREMSPEAAAREIVRLVGL